jgi:hypothetical protein
LGHDDPHVDCDLCVGGCYGDLRNKEKADKGERRDATPRMRIRSSHFR